MRVALLVPAGFAAGAALCTWLLRFAPAAVNVDRMQPLVVVTYWQNFGAWMWLAFALAIAIASLGYVTLLRSMRRPEVSTDGRARRGLLLIAAMSAVACAAALLFPVVFSSDVYAYAGYGDMALHGISPYAHARITAGDPLLDAVVWQWGNPPPMCVYGPAFVWLAQAIVAVFLPLGVAAPLWAFRVLACLALAACAPLAYAAFRGFPQNTRLAAAAGIALNPVAIWSAAEGHNDALALAIVLAGFALAARSRAFAGALIVALSALVKAPGAIAAVALAISAWRDRSRFARLATGAGAGMAIVAALAIPLEYGVRAHLAPHGRYFPQFSPQYVSIPLAAVLVAAVLLAVFGASPGSAVLRYLGMTQGYLGMARGGFTVTLLVAFAGWMAIPNPYPWYAVWLLPIAFLAWDTRAAWALVAASLLIAFRFYPDATTAAFPHAFGDLVVLLEFGLPLALLSAHMVTARRDRRESRTTAPDFAAPRSP